MSLSAAQKSFINHLVIKYHDEKRGITDGSMSDALFCKDILKCHPNTVLGWKKNPEFKAALDKAITEYETGRDYFKTVLRYKALEELWVQYVKAAGSEKRQYLAMVLRETEEVENYRETTDYEAMSDAELAEIALNKNIELPEGLTRDSLQKLKKGAK